MIINELLEIVSKKYAMYYYEFKVYIIYMMIINELLETV